MIDTKSIIISVIILIVLVYLYYSAIIGIIRKKFSPIMILILLGANINSKEQDKLMEKLEGSEAQSAAIIQLFFTALITIVLVFGLLGELSNIMSQDTYNYLVPITIIVCVIVSIYYGIRLQRKFKALKKEQQTLESNNPKL